MTDDEILKLILLTNAKTVLDLDVMTNKYNTKINIKNDKIYIFEKEILFFCSLWYITQNNQKIGKYVFNDVESQLVSVIFTKDNNILIIFPYKNFITKKIIREKGFTAVYDYYAFLQRKIFINDDEIFSKFEEFIP